MKVGHHRLAEFRTRKKRALFNLDDVLAKRHAGLTTPAARRLIRSG